ncbi:MAG: hypothetical protein SGJ13_11875 [Actinomycetota bacterium]|nr:hypothetical protein [Actinomycetota bacterium]
MSPRYAILGLRALYFLLAGMAGKFRYLNIGLGVITCVLTATIVASLRAERRHPSLVPAVTEPGAGPSDR